MKLWILSDLHLEFPGNAALASLRPPEGTQVVVLAGDIHVGAEGVSWALGRFPGLPVVYVAGNHECYRHDWHRLPGELRERARRSDVRFLEDRAVDIGGIRFVGCALWTDFLLFGQERRDESVAACKLRLNDFRMIPGLTEEAWCARHRRSRRFLERQLRGRDNTRTVVVTHHLPSRLSVAAQYVDDLTSAGFASDLHSLIADTQPAAWIHGHTHASLRYRIGRTEVVCNPAGYPFFDGRLENTEFDRALTVDVL